MNGTAYPLTRRPAGGPPPRPVGARAVRNAGLDLLRLAAALVIVLFHAHAPGGALMPAALGLFAAMLGLFAAEGAADFAPLARRRAGRLLRPFAIWAAFYAALRLADAVAAHQPLLPTLTEWLPPRGSMGPLWFLPFAFAASLGAAAARRALPALNRPGVALPVAAAFAALWLPLLAALAPPEGIMVFLAYLPALGFGLALAAAGSAPGWLAATALTATVVGLAHAAAGIPGAQQLWLAVPLVALALLRPLPGSPATARAAELSMAVYLLHVFVLAVLLRVTPFGLGSLALGLAGFAGAAALGRLLIATPLGRRLF